MKKLIFLFVPLLSILIFWSCEQEVLDPGFDTKSSVHKEQMKFHKSKLQNRVLLTEALTDNVIGNTNVRKMQIYTPPGYDRQGDESYPVVYLLHGLPFSEKAFTDISTWDEWVDPN
ncbi:MAG: hypothetical protein KDC56_01240, partial [Flavobacteriaceae bacterium]|nr:hypothetical protein [Flavobacteriaceae bacterium]